MIAMISAYLVMKAESTDIPPEVSMLNTIFQLGGTALLCRMLPKVKPPCSYSLVSIRAQIAALKMSMVLQAGSQSFSRSGAALAQEAST